MSVKTYVQEKLWPFLAGMGSAMIMILAFFIPSLQDQWDRYQSRKIITQYEQLGNEFYDEDKYDMAEQAYQKAFELSDSKRLDIEIKRMNAKINRINMNPRWGTTPPEDLEEIDFQYVLHLQRDAKMTKEQVATLNSYGIFLAASSKPQQAEKAFLEAAQLDPSDATAFINLGNLYDQQGKKQAATTLYQKAISLDKSNTRAHYNLGLLYYEQGKIQDAKNEFSQVLQVDSTDTDARKQYELTEQAAPRQP
ncbi:MAG: tetratricopeptide repeat protein [Chitinophagaceae bacterium]